MPAAQPPKTAQYVLKLIKDIFNKNIDKFDLFSDGDNHWEKWFQIELASRLRKEKAREVKLEYRFLFDGKKKNTTFRAKKGAAKGYIDLVYRPKYASLDYYVGIELKQTKSLQGLVRLMEDVVKLRAARKTEWNFRSLYFVLLCKEPKVRNKFVRLLEDLEAIKPITCSTLKFDRGAGFWAVVLYWDPNKYKSSCDIQLYEEWFGKIEECFVKHDPENYAKIVSSSKKEKKAISRVASAKPTPSS